MVSNLQKSDLSQAAVASWFKRFVGKFAGLLSGVKFNKRIAGRFGEFEAIEFNSLGRLGKRAFWRMLKSSNSKI